MRQLETNTSLISKGRKNNKKIIVGKRAYQIHDIIVVKMKTGIEHNSRKFKKNKDEKE